MNIFSFLMIVSFISYIYVGIYVIYIDRKAALNRIFLALNLSFAIWALTNAFMVSAPDKHDAMVWNMIGSIGYCSFANFALHFSLIYTKKEKLLKKWWICKGTY